MNEEAEAPAVEHEPNRSISGGLGYAWSSAGEIEEHLQKTLGDEATKIKIRLEGDTVVIGGQVESEETARRIVEAIRKFHGVNKLRNEITQPPGKRRSRFSDRDDAWLLDEFGTGREFRPRVFGRTSRHEERPRQAAGPRSNPPDTGDESKTRLDTEASAGVVQGFPDLKQSGPIEGGAVVEIAVDLLPDDEGGGEPLVLSDLPDGWDRIEVGVQLVAPWIDKLDVLEPKITIERYGATSAAKFRCTVSAGHSTDDLASVTAFFFHGTRPCGTRLFPLDGRSEQLGERQDDAEVGPSEADGTLGRSAIGIAWSAPGATMTVWVSTIGEGRQKWTWSTFLPGGRRRTRQADVEVGPDTRSFAKALELAAPDLPVDEFRSKLNGFGVQIWKQTPSQFRKDFEETRRSSGDGFPIQLMIDDPHVPWELMVPEMEGLGSDHLYLDHPVARWPVDTDGFMKDVIPAGKILSFVPKYADYPLAAAQNEGEWLASAHGAERVTPDRKSFLDALHDARGEPVCLLHFAGHARASDNPLEAELEFEGGRVSVLEIGVKAVKLGSERGTFVILNACETSAGTNFLGTNVGWGTTLAERDFGGLIAPLWAVQDREAGEIMRDLIPALLGGTETIGSAMAHARAKHAESSVASFAYLAHGDVMARFARQ